MSPIFPSRGRRSARVAAQAVVLAVALAASTGCAAPSAGETQAPKADEATVIQHRQPRRDSVGPQPETFAWTAVPGADRYAIGLWNEVDRLLWRNDDIRGTSIARPAELDLEEGTYFWTVSALKDGKEIAKSGLAAFVVER